MAVKHSAEVTINDLTDAYGVTLTNEAATFKATSDTKLGTAATATTKPQAFLGTEAVACTVDKDACVRSDTSNVTVSVNNTGDNATWPLVTITIGANATAGGTVTIPVVIGTGSSAVTFEKVFSYSIALKGTKGDNITVSSTAYAYAKSTSGTTPPSSGWGTTPVAPTTTEYAWTRTTATFSDGSSAVTYSVGGKVGAAGTAGTSPTVTGTTTQYQKSTSGTTVPTGTWSDSALAPDTSNFVWTKTTITYSDGATAVTYAVAGKVGATGTAGGRWYSGTGITGTSTTATAFSDSGVSSAVVGDMYLNTSTYNTYRCTVAGAPSAAKWVYVNNVKGAKGDAGDDPYTLAITSSAGTVFRNGSGSTTLTCHIFRAGAELSAVPSGMSVKWYKDGGSTAVGTGLTLTVNASDVDSKAAYVCQLEG